MVVFAMLTAACGQDPGQIVAVDAGVMQTTTFGQISQTMRAGCAFSVCHSPHGMASSGGLDLSQDAWLNMVNLPAHNMRAAAEGMKVIKPCDPEHSLLYVKLTSDSYGAQMPLGNPALSAEALKRIHDWIARGALLSEPATAQGSVCTY